ncbi:hypothetical protein AURDEDRAFT_169519 [Auricularia subglabra TFB-10046 SS5]|uniref:Uncharacterized protein n=1 Tax=Auricularia subglabra (strain TFB-10046 / SS5) TaxID=717982 RepID=J0WYP6_AURST|nr:hypothetical protein AURDEDRAFT_169519 [Auricularia subglabra TFB-10046 SS5]
MSASSSQSSLSSAHIAASLRPGSGVSVEEATVRDADGLYARQDAEGMSSESLPIPGPTHASGPRRNVSFIVIPAVLVPIIVLAVAVIVYLIMRRRRIERHRREVKELTTRPFSRLMSFGNPAAAAAAGSAPPPPPSVLDIRRSLYASTIHTVPLGAESIAPSSPASARTSFMEPPTPSRRSDVVSTLAPGTVRGSVDSRFWPSPLEPVPPVPDIPKHLNVQLRYAIRGVESEAPESPRNSLAGTTLRGSVDSRRWSAWSAAKHPVPELPPPVPELPPLPAQEHAVPTLDELPVHPSLHGLPRLVVDAPARTPSTSSTSSRPAPAPGPTALAPMPSSPPAPPRRKRKTLLMERRERRLKLAIADAQFTGAAPLRERDEARPSPALPSPPLPSPPLPSPLPPRTPPSATGPPVPAPARRPLGPRTLSQQSSISSPRTAAP